MDTKPYSVREAARVLVRSTSTIVFWLENGDLEEFPSHGHQRLITAESLHAKAAQLGIALSDGGEAA